MSRGVVVGGHGASRRGRQGHPSGHSVAPAPRLSAGARSQAWPRLVACSEDAACGGLLKAAEALLRRGAGHMMTTMTWSSGAHPRQPPPQAASRCAGLRQGLLLSSAIDATVQPSRAVPASSEEASAAASSASRRTLHAPRAAEGLRADGGSTAHRAPTACGSAHQAPRRGEAAAEGLLLQAPLEAREKCELWVGRRRRREELARPPRPPASAASSGLPGGARDGGGGAAGRRRQRVSVQAEASRRLARQRATPGHTMPLAVRRQAACGGAGPSPAQPNRCTSSSAGCADSKARTPRGAAAAAAAALQYY